MSNNNNSNNQSSLTNSEVEQIINAVANSTARISDKQLEMQLALTKLQKETELALAKLEHENAQKAREMMASFFAGLGELILDVVPKLIENEKARTEARYKHEAEMEAARHSNEMEKQKTKHLQEMEMQEAKLQTAKAASGKFEESSWETKTSEYTNGAAFKKTNKKESKTDSTEM